MSSTLSDKTLFARFLKLIKEEVSGYSTKSAAEKQDFFQKVANFLCQEIGLPRLNIVNNKIEEYSTIGQFDILKGQIELNTTRLNNTSTDEFLKVASVFYHEVRHAEQAFRGLQHYFSFPSSAEVLKSQKSPLSRSVVASNTGNFLFANSAKATILPEDRKAFAREMFKAYITKYSSDGRIRPRIEYELEPIEKDAFVFQRESYKALGGVPNNWYPKAFNAAKPLLLTDPGSFQILISPDGKKVTIDGQTVNLSPIPIKKLNRRADATLGSDVIGGDVTLVAGIPVTEAADDFIEGLDGNDYIFGLEGNDYLYGNIGNDTLRGDNENDYLDGGEANDSLVGGSGDDVLEGGEGNDTYYVDSAFDVIQGESSTSGKDLVYSSVSINLISYIENLTLIGNGNITGAGNTLNNLLVGNNKVNILNGLGGDDTLYGLDGNDTLKGGDGDDYLNGDDKPLTGEGDDAEPVYIAADRMEGGIGDDTYVVNSSADVVVEDTNQGNDTIISSISYNLDRNVENLTLIGSGNLTGAGNVLNNLLIGNDQVNILNGLAGNDAIYGEGGNDQLIGGMGNDTLSGGEGADTLLGSGGANCFILDDFDEMLSPSSSGVDTLRDFQAGVDKIQLQRSSFTALTTNIGSPLKISEFAKVTDDALAATSSGLIVYSQSSGRLFYNSNGAAIGYGTGGEIAILSERPSNLGASDIFVI
jgi:Ca2+-binding RTX toxin-like protein